MLLSGALAAIAVIVVFFLRSRKNDVEVVHLVPPEETGPAVPQRLAANKQPIVSPPPSPVSTRELERVSRSTPVDLDTAIAQALRAGNKIEAIKHYREKTGLGLKEAKDAIEAMVRGAAPPPLPSSRAPSTNLDAAIAQALRKGNKIGAIKLYREKTGLGLKEAKDAIDAMASGAPPPPLPTPPTDDDMVDAIDAALRADQLIQAIKLYREKTGLGLAEAKRAVEARRAHLLGQR